MDDFLDSPLLAEGKDLFLPSSAGSGIDLLRADSMDLSSYGVDYEDLLSSLLPSMKDFDESSDLYMSGDIPTHALTDHDYLSQAKATDSLMTMDPNSPCASSDSGAYTSGDDAAFPSPTSGGRLSATPPLLSPTDSSSSLGYTADYSNHTGSSVDSSELADPTAGGLDMLSSMLELEFDKEELERALEGIPSDGLRVTPDMFMPAGDGVAPIMSSESEGEISPGLDGGVNIDDILSGLVDNSDEEEEDEEFGNSVSVAGAPVRMTRTGRDQRAASSAPYCVRSAAPSAASNSGYPVLELSREEKQLLDKEGISLPTNMPLTRSEEKVLRAVRRRIRNKESARNSRKKKQVYVDQLEERVKMTATENKQLKQRVQKLEDTNSSLFTQLKKLQNLVTNATQKPVKRSTCAMILALSFAFFLMPSYQSYTANEEGTEIIKTTPMPGRSRNILTLDDERIQKHMPFCRNSLKCLLAEAVVDPQDVAIQGYVDREMSNDTGMPGDGGYLSVRLGKDKTAIIDLHDHSKDLPAMTGTASKMKTHVQV